MLKRQTAPEHMSRIAGLEKIGLKFFDGTPEEERAIAKASLVEDGYKEKEITKEQIDELIENNYWLRKKVA